MASPLRGLATKYSCKQQWGGQAVKWPIKHVRHPQKRVTSTHNKFGVNPSKICWDTTQLPVCWLNGTFWLAVPGKRFWKSKKHMMAFVRLGLKMISAKFGENWKTFVGGVKKKRFFSHSKWRPHQFGCYHKLSCVTHWMSHDIMRQRNHLIKANESTVIGQNTFLHPAATPSDHMTPNWLGILRRGFRVILPSLVLISQGLAEIWPNFLFGCFVANFDWSYRTNGFENQKPFDKYSEGCSNDDVCRI